MLSLDRIRSYIGDPYADAGLVVTMEAGIIAWLEAETDFYLGLPATRVGVFDGPPVKLPSLATEAVPVRKIYLPEVPTVGMVTARFWDFGLKDWSATIPDSAFRYQGGRNLLQRAWVEYLAGEWPIGSKVIEMSWSAGFAEDQGPPLIEDFVLQMFLFRWRQRATDYATSQRTEGWSVSYSATIDAAGLRQAFDEIRPTREWP